MIQKEIHTIKGMSKDIDKSKSNASLLYDAQNIRITTREDETLFAITNERGTKDVPLKGLKIEGTVLGHCVINEYIIIFTTDSFNKTDYIYLIKYSNSQIVEAYILYKGNLNFSEKHPIETLGIYENENVQKVYWIDGLNQTRGINIAADGIEMESWDNRSFDFIQILDLKEKVSIERFSSSNNGFHSGVVQYALTYYNIYGSESNIFYVSPLMYLSKEDRGGSPEETVNNSFKIHIDNVDTRFKYIRTYQITRTSIDGTPVVKRLQDIRTAFRDQVTKTDLIKKDFIFTGLNFNKLSFYKNNNLESLQKYKTKEYTEDRTLITEYTLNITHKDYLESTKSENGIFCIEDPTLESQTIIITHKRYYSRAEETKITSDKPLGFYSYKISYVNEAIIVDNNTQTEVVDATELLYKGGEEIVFQTMTQKDNTLFLGNAELKRPMLSDSIDNLVQELEFNFNTSDQLVIDKISGNYPYENTLKEGANIQTYKTNEWYRIGIQFQHNTGKWSEPLFVGDYYNNGYENKPSISYEDDVAYLRLVKGSVELGVKLQNELIKQGYVKARGVIVYPSASDREVIFQGVACPTLYNVEDRANNKNYVIPSWFSRPNVGPDVEESKGNKSAILNLITDKSTYTTIEEVTSNNITKNKSKGYWAEFRHNKPIPNNWESNSEIQCLCGVPDTPYTDFSKENKEKWIRENKECFFVDQSVVTLHSPDLEFNEQLQNLDSTSLKMRIVGYVPFTGNMSNLDIQLTTSPQDINKGVSIYDVGISNISPHGHRSLMAGSFYTDSVFDPKKGYENKTFDYVIYPWSKEDSLMNQNLEEDGEAIPGLMKSKKMSNLKYSFNSYFLEDVFNFEDPTNELQGIAGVQVINGDQPQLITLYSPKNTNIGDIYYSPVVDTIINPSLVDKEYTPNNPQIPTFNKKNGYLITYDKETRDGSSFNSIGDVSNVFQSKKPVKIRYKTTPHAIVALNYSLNRNQIIMPTNTNRILEANNVIKQPDPGQIPFWSTIYPYEIIQPVINIPQDYGYLWLVEIYNDNVVNRFGGISKQAINNNNWLPAGDSVTLKDDGQISVPYTNSDTYYQRYDCLKTYPYSLDDVNTMVDIMSFMCETRVNIDGRYDRNRGRENNLVMTPKIFNLMNPVYTQTDNYFNYRALDKELFSTDKFPNTITWTKEKQFGSEVDTWTNITMASVLDLDGDKGEITSLNTYNNEIFCFQTKGFSNILFNSRVQIPSSDGVPIEISNSYKVDGKRYISEQVGCTNKWSIVESVMGLYFIDNFTNTIYLYNGQMNPLSDSQGFRNWLSKYKDYSPWNPLEFNNIKTFYDRNNKDVYFVHKDFCLGFSELLGNFVSFYSYNAVPVMFNVSNKFYSIKDNKVWEMFAGDYNIFFDHFKEYSLTLISNENPTFNKMFHTVEYISDLFDDNNKIVLDQSFDEIEIETDIEKGTDKLEYIVGRPSNLKRKFRVWRANIPRSNDNKLKRVTNPWAKIKLTKNKYNTLKMKMKDIIVNYGI